MKRMWVAAAIMIVILSCGCLVLWHIDYVATEMDRSLELLSQAIEQKKTDQVQYLADSFEREWEHNSKYMVFYIHHNQLDDITGSVARFSAYARHEDELGELSAEVESVRGMIWNLRESEMPVFHNIF